VGASLLAKAQYQSTLMAAVKMPSRTGSLPQDLRDFVDLYKVTKNLNSLSCKRAVNSASSRSKSRFKTLSRRQRRRSCPHHTYPRSSRQKPRTCRYV